jgi:hypothetical protein
MSILKFCKVPSEKFVENYNSVYYANKKNINKNFQKKTQSVVKFTKKPKKISKAEERKLKLHDILLNGVEVVNINSKEDVLKSFIQIVENTFRHGAGKRNVDLRVYTGPSLELIGEYAIRLCLKSLKVNETRFQINQSYIKDDFYDNLRLDEHLIIDGTYIMMQEDRAWVDKPFANMKYQVAQDIFTLNYSSVKFWSELIIPILCYSYDITEKTFTTRDFVFKRTLNCEGVSEYNKFGEYRIKFFNISGNGRDSYGDYFSNGFSYKECESYIDCIYNHINNFVNDKIV